MHAEAYEFVRAAAASHGPFERVCEYGSYDVNGTVRDLFEHDDLERYHGIDLRDGRGVDQVADMRTWSSRTKYDCIVSTSAFEHAAGWEKAVAGAYENLRENGTLIVTTVADPWPAHGPNGEIPLPAGTHYEGVEAEAIKEAAEKAGFVTVAVESHDNGDQFYLGVKS